MNVLLVRTDPRVKDYSETYSIFFSTEKISEIMLTARFIPS